MCCCLLHGCVCVGKKICTHSKCQFLITPDDLSGHACLLNYFKQKILKWRQKFFFDPKGEKILGQSTPQELEGGPRRGAIRSSHLCFNTTIKEQTIVPDWYNRNLQYTRKYFKNNVFQ